MIDAIPLIPEDSRRTCVFSPENLDGTPNGGTHGGPNDKLSACISVAPSQTITLVDTDGPGVVANMWFGGETENSFVLRIFWDGCDFPSVECPLCSFFGYGLGITDDGNGGFPILNSAMVLVAPCRGLNCYWQMPFLKHCRITLENRNSRDMLTFYTVSVIKQSLPANIAYFHASYRQAIPLTRGTEYTIIDGIKGSGYLAGVSLSVGTNGCNGCWVEGEAKVFIDGDTYPSVNYTGTEDYFCGSFAFSYDITGKYEPYCGLYAGMFYAGVNLSGRYRYQPRFMMYRWHVPDPIYFSSELRMTLQDIPDRYDDFTSAAYWYQSLPSALAPLPSASQVKQL